MNGIHFLALPMLNFFWLLPLFIALLAYAAYKRRQALALLIENRLYHRQAVFRHGPHRRWQYLRSCIVRRHPHRCRPG